MRYFTKNLHILLNLHETFYEINMRYFTEFRWDILLNLHILQNLHEMFYEINMQYFIKFTCDILLT